MSIKLKTENNVNIVTVNNENIIFQNLKMAIHYISILKRDHH